MGCTICACGSGGGGDKDKVTLIVDLHGWMPTINTTATASTPNVYNSPRYIAEAFEKLYPEVKIEWARTKNVGGSSNDASGEMSSYFINAIEREPVPPSRFRGERPIRSAIIISISPNTSNSPIPLRQRRS